MGWAFPRGRTSVGAAYARDNAERSDVRGCGSLTAHLVVWAIGCLRFVCDHTSERMGGAIPLRHGASSSPPVADGKCALLPRANHRVRGRREAQQIVGTVWGDAIIDRTACKPDQDRHTGPDGRVSHAWPAEVGWSPR